MMVMMIDTEVSYIVGEPRSQCLHCTCTGTSDMCIKCVYNNIIVTTHFYK